MVVRQWWVMFPNGSYHFYCCNLCDAVHHSNICKVDYKTETSVMWSNQVSKTIRQQKKKTHGNWFLSDYQGGSFCCRWMFSTVSHKVVLFNALSSVAVSNYYQVVKTLYCWKCLSIYLEVILAHYPDPVKHSHNVSPEVLPAVWSPNIDWKLMTLACTFHFSASISIQWAVTPRNTAFVISTVQVSVVIETDPRASFIITGASVTFYTIKNVNSLDFYFQPIHPMHKLIM